MELQVTPNRWSCLPTSFAMACGVPLKDFLTEIGHRGDAIAFPGLPEPLCRRTFHIDECTRACAAFGHAVTCLQFDPILSTDGTNQLHIPTDTEYLLRFDGVLTGMGRRHGHAVAWDGRAQRVYDPAGAICNYGQNQFTARTIYVVDIQYQMDR